MPVALAISPAMTDPAVQVPRTALPAGGDDDFDQILRAAESAPASGESALVSARGADPRPGPARPDAASSLPDAVQTGTAPDAGLAVPIQPGPGQAGVASAASTTAVLPLSQQPTGGPGQPDFGGFGQTGVVPGAPPATSAPATSVQATSTQATSTPAASVQAVSTRLSSTPATSSSATSTQAASTPATPPPLATAAGTAASQASSRAWYLGPGAANGQSALTASAVETAGDKNLGVLAPDGPPDSRALDQTGAPGSSAPVSPGDASATTLAAMPGSSGIETTGPLSATAGPAARVQSGPSARSSGVAQVTRLPSRRSAGSDGTQAAGPPQTQSTGAAQVVPAIALADPSVAVQAVSAPIRGDADHVPGGGDVAEDAAPVASGGSRQNSTRTADTTDPTASAPQSDSAAARRTEQQHASPASEVPPSPLADQPSAPDGAGRIAEHRALSRPADAAEALAPSPAIATPATPPQAAIIAPLSNAAIPTIAATQVAAHAVPAPVAAQIAPALVTLARTADGTQQMTVRLQPDDLGMVQVRIDRISQGATQIDITADNPATLQALQRDQLALHHSLDEAGIPAAGRSVTFHIVQPSSASSSGTGSGPQHAWAGRSNSGPSDSGGSASGANNGGRGAYANRDNSRWAASRSTTPSSTATSPTGATTYRVGLDITA